jgi:Outer membrane protein beta-barrel domain
MRLRFPMLVFALLACTPALATAQDFGVLESAETINLGNFKLRGNPMFLFGKDTDSTTGIALSAGYGFTPRFDAEGNLAFYDGVTMFGGNGEYWLVKGRGLDFSLAGGLHARRGDRTADIWGIDLTFLASRHLTPKFELYGGVDFGFEKVENSSGYETVHLTPGIEYRLARDLDLVSEFGIGLNRDSRHYFAMGLAFYVR